MANTDAPFGLRYIGMAGGASPNSSLRSLTNGILYTNTTPIYKGDILTMQDTGYLRQWLPATSIAADLWGIFAGCEFAMSTPPEKRFFPYWPGANAREGTVKASFYPVDPMAEYVIQTDSTGITVAALGEVADIAVGTGNASSGLSGAYLDVSKINTTAANASLRIVDLWANRAPAGSPGTEAGAYNWAVVRLNTMTEAQGA